MSSWMSWMECSRDSKGHARQCYSSFRSSTFDANSQLFTSYTLLCMKRPTLISSHPCFALPVGFQRICSEHHLPGFWEYDTLRCQSGGRVGGALPAGG